MSDYVEFKAKLLNKLEKAWNECNDGNIPNLDEKLARVEALFEIWRDSKKVEARLE
jgi:hypothetical protein